MTCHYCQSRNADGALVCASCGRDIAVPASLIAERDDLLRKRDDLRHELKCARDEVEALIMLRRKPR